MTRVMQVSLLVLISLAGAIVAAVVNGPGAVSQGSHRELAALASAMARLQVSTGRIPGSVDDAVAGADEHESHEDLDFEAIVARERELAERRAAAIIAAAERETVDARWAPAAEARLAAGIAAKGPPGTKLIAASCKTTLCIAEIEHPVGANGTGDVGWLSALGLPRAFFVCHEAEPDRGARTMAYLARDGHSLPGVEPSAAERAR